MADEDAAYADSIRRQPCHQCYSPLQVQLHHHTYGSTVPWENGATNLSRPRGKGERAHDSWGIPLCVKCHRNFHSATGFCAGWSHQQRRDWQNAAVAEYRGAYLDPTAF